MKGIELALLFLSLTSFLAYKKHRDITDKVVSFVTLYCGITGIIAYLFSYFSFESSNLIRFFVALFKFSLPVGGLIIVEEATTSKLDEKEIKKEFLWNVLFYCIIYFGGIVFFLYKPILGTIQHEKLIKFFGTTTYGISIYLLISIVVFLSGLFSLIPLLFKGYFWGISGLVGLGIITNSLLITLSSYWASTILHIGRVEFGFFTFIIISSGILYILKFVSGYNQFFMSVRYKIEKKGKGDG